MNWKKPTHVYVRNLGRNYKEKAICTAWDSSLRQILYSQIEEENEMEQIEIKSQSLKELKETMAKTGRKAF